MLEVLMRDKKTPKLYFDIFECIATPNSFAIDTSDLHASLLTKKLRTSEMSCQVVERLGLEPEFCVLFKSVYFLEINH